MRLGVLLARRSHLKTLSPVIDAGLARGHEVTLVCEPIPAKKGDRLDVQEVARLWPEARIGSTRDYGRVQALVGLDACLPDLKSIRVVGVDAFYDRWLKPLRPGMTYAWTCAYHREVHELLHKPFSHTGSIVGWLPGDQGLGVPSTTRDIAVFFALKMDVPEPWRSGPDGRALYRDVFEAARSQAHAEGLKFVVKSRRKNGDPWYVRWRCDQYVLDEQMVPYTSLQLLARAKWCVHFESGAGLEAALMGAYSIAVQVRQDHIIDLPGGRLQYGYVEMHNWPGVTQYGWPIHMVPSVDPVARQAYMDKYLGPVDGKAGQRVVDLAES